MGVSAFFVLFMLGHFIRIPSPGDEGPWGSVLLLAAAVIGFLAVPVYQGVRDLVLRRGGTSIAVLRLATLVIIVTVVLITVRIGGDTAEAGIFMVPISAASAGAIVFVAWFEWWRARRRLAQPPES